MSGQAASLSHLARPGRPRPLWAFLLSILPGLGHVYARLWARGAGLLALAVIGAILLRRLTRLVAPTPHTVMAFLAASALAVLVLLAMAIDAARQSRSALDRPRPRWFHSTWFSAIAWIVIASLVPPATGAFGWRSFSIESSSMEPALRAGDLWMAKATAGQPAAIPARGDVVVFPLPGQPGTDYVKRVMGLPGDRVALRQGIVVLNGTPLPRVADGIVASPDGGIPSTTRRYIETLPGGPSFAVLEPGKSGIAEDMAETTVPLGRMFLLGDNRDNSLDSRFPRVGMAPVDTLVATLGILYWSRDQSRLFQPVK